MAGDDCGFDVAAAVQHVAQDLLQARERCLSGNVVCWSNLFCGDQAKGAADSFRRVMEGGLERDLGIVQAVGIELYFGATGTSAKEIDRATLPDHLDGPLPGLSAAHGLDDDITAAFLWRQRAHSFNYILHFCGLYDFMCTH